MGCEVDYVNGLGGGWRMPSKPCDSCRTGVAALFCRTDSAFLCLVCDDRFHGANKLASRHARVWVCEVCEHAPAAVTCKADAAVLCISCDADIHSANPLARRHERVPVVPFLDSAAAALKSTCELDVFIPEADGGPRAEDEVTPPWMLPTPCMEMEVPNIMSEAEVKCVDNNDILLNVMDDPYVDFDFGFPVHGGSDSVVPVQVKTEEPLFQVKPPEKCFDIEFCRSKLTSFAYPAQYNRKNLLTSSSSPDFGLVPDGSTTNTSMSDRSQSFVGSINSYVTAAGNVVNSCVADHPSITVDIAPPAAPVPVTPLSGVDREARVLRYREKRKNRKFEKTIRYASRKAYAETRPRIKGRFAKRTDSHEPQLFDNRQIFGRSASTAIFFGDCDFGIVPTF